MSRTVQVLSSNGKDHYTVTLDDRGKAVSCDQTCMGWHHRQACRHLARAEELAQEQDKPKQKRD